MVGKVDSSGWRNYAAVRWLYGRGGRDSVERVTIYNGFNSTALTTLTTYDASGRVSALTSTSPGTWYSFTGPIYNRIDQLKSFSSREPNFTGGPSGAQNWSTTLTYDSAGGTWRLLTSDKTIQSGASRHHTYRFDLLGNRQYEFRNSGFETGCAQNGPDTSSFGPVNQLVRTFNSCLAQNHYWSDNAGNRLVQLDTSAGGSYLGPQNLLSYTAKGQLFFSMSPTGSVGTYDYNWHWYDATGQRMLTWRTTGFNWAPDSLPPGGVRTYYVYDGNDVALSIHRSGTGGFAVRARYLVGGVDNAIAGRFAGEFTTPKNLALINDRQGTTLAAMRGDGTQEDNITYFTKDPFGGLIGATNQGGSMNTETGFAGASTPNASGGFVYLRNRWYDPKTGRFLTQDPIGLAGGVNLYAYAGNNPVAFDDPFGLGPCTDPRTPRTCAFINGVASRTKPLYDAQPVVMAVAASPLLPFAAMASAPTAVAILSDIATTVGPDIGQRAGDIHGTLSARTQNSTTTAVATAQSADGSTTTLVGSSEGVLRPAQRAALRAGEVAVAGRAGTHAEINVLNAAARNGQRVRAIAASRAICPDCAKALRAVGAIIKSILK